MKMSLPLMFSLNSGRKHKSSDGLELASIVVKHLIIQVVFRAQMITKVFKNQHFGMLGRTAQLISLILDRIGLKLFQVLSTSFLWVASQHIFWPFSIQPVVSMSV